MATEKLIQECKNDSNSNRLGKLTIDGYDEPLTNSDRLQSFSITSGCYNNGNIVGSVYVKSLDASLLDINSYINLTDKQINAQIGVLFDDDTVEYINMGNYIVERPKSEITADMGQIVGYDKLGIHIDDKYECQIDYSTGDKTLKDLYVDVCKQLELNPKTTDILNGDIPITDNPFTNNETNRIVLQTVATVACSYVVIDLIDDTIDLGWLSQNDEPDYTFEMSEYVTLEGGDIQYGPVNVIVIKNSQVDDENVTEQDDESIALNGEHKLIISEDYILHSQELREMAMPKIYERLLGLKYIDLKLTSSYGKPFLNIGDKIRVISDKGELDTYLLKHTFTYDGTFGSVIESPALTEQEIKTKQLPSVREAIRRVEIDVNKQLGEITQTVEETNDNLGDQETRLSKLEQTSNSFDITIQEQQNQLNNLENMQDELDRLKDADNNLKNSLDTMNGIITDMNFSFQTEGLKIGRTGEKINSLLDNAGLRIYNLSTLISIFNKNGAGFNKLIAVESIQIQSLKMKPTNITSKHFSGTKKAVGLYHLEHLIEDLSDLESDSLE